MKHFFYSAFFLVTMLSISSCAMNEGMKPVNLSVDNVVSKFGDSIFLSSQVPCIDAKNGSVYITDYRAGVYALDSKLNLISKMSNIGRGFGEVNRPAKFFVDDNNVITLYNEGLQRYSYFEKDSFLMADNASVKENLAKSCRFFARDGAIYQSVLGGKFLVSVIKNGNVTKQMCPTVDGVDFPSNVALSERHLLEGDNCFYVIGLGLPIVQAYSFDGRELARFNLVNIPLLESVYAKNENLKSSNSYYEVVRDAYYKNGFIYLLTSSFEGKYKCNTIIVLKKNADNIQYVSAYTLKNNLYSTFCINDQNECLAVCSKNSSIEVYKLPKVK